MCVRWQAAKWVMKAYSEYTNTLTIHLNAPIVQTKCIVELQTHLRHELLNNAENCEGLEVFD